MLKDAKKNLKGQHEEKRKKMLKRSEANSYSMRNSEENMISPNVHVLVLIDHSHK